MTEVDYPVMPEPEWAKPRDKKMQSTVWPVSFSLEFVPFMFVDEKTLPCSFEDVTFFSELKSKTENNVTKCLHFYYQRGCLKVWKLLPVKIGSWFCLEFSSWWLFFDDPNIPRSYPKNRKQSHMPECCLSKMKRSLLKQTGNHGNQWTSYKGKCWFDP